MDRRAFVLASASLLIAPRALARTGTEVEIGDETLVWE